MATEDIDTAYRAGVGIMLLNGRGEVFVARRIDTTEPAWQMPQGGIDAGEAPRDAALRELREEVGTDKAEIIAESGSWMIYDLPAEIVAPGGAARWRGQRQKWFVMRFTGVDADIDLATAHPEFSAWRWAPVNELPALAVSFKRQVYRDLLSEFGALTQTADQRFSELLDLLRRMSATLRERGR
jgi:putative (di)nucleoside polyphosphate hydrolase